MNTMSMKIIWIYWNTYVFLSKIGKNNLMEVIWNNIDKIIPKNNMDTLLPDVETNSVLADTSTIIEEGVIDVKHNDTNNIDDYYSKIECKSEEIVKKDIVEEFSIENNEDFFQYMIEEYGDINRENVKFIIPFIPWFNFSFVEEILIPKNIPYVVYFPSLYSQIVKSYDYNSFCKINMNLIGTLWEEHKKMWYNVYMNASEVLFFKDIKKIVREMAKDSDVVLSGIIKEEYDIPRYITQQCKLKHKDIYSILNFKYVPNYKSKNAETTNDSEIWTSNENKVSESWTEQLSEQKESWDSSNVSIEVNGENTISNTNWDGWLKNWGTGWNVEMIQEWNDLEDEWNDVVKDTAEWISKNWFALYYLYQDDMISG